MFQPNPVNFLFEVFISFAFSGDFQRFLGDFLWKTPSGHPVSIRKWKDDGRPVALKSQKRGSHFGGSVGFTVLDPRGRW